MSREKRGVARNAATNVTIKDVADHLGIAHSTVSRALSDHPYTNKETKERVRHAVEKLGYVPHAAARALRADKGLLVGLILPNIDNDAFATAAQILSQRCLKAGLQMVLGLSGDDPEIEYGQVMTLRAARAQGIVIAPSRQPLKKTLDLLQSVPTVQYARRHAALRVPAVTVDGARGIALATQHLLQLGHRRIGYLGPDRSNSTGAERLDGFIAAQKQAGIRTDLSLAHYGPMENELARATVLGLVQRSDGPTALVFGSGALMTGALAGLRDARLQVPRDISVVGYGNPDWYEVWGAGITTIEQPFVEMANAAASQLMRQVSADRSAGTLDIVHLKLEPAFILRDSTAPLAPRSRRAAVISKRPT